jgi:hypothetical protein
MYARALAAGLVLGSALLIAPSSASAVAQQFPGFPCTVNLQIDQVLFNPYVTGGSSQSGNGFSGTGCSRQDTTIVAFLFPNIQVPSSRTCYSPSRSNCFAKPADAYGFAQYNQTRRWVSSNNNVVQLNY